MITNLTKIPRPKAKDQRLNLLKPQASGLKSNFGGFTLVEMLVAVAMGAALIAAAATVFSLASQAVGTSQANTEINTQLRILFSWLDRDFARIRLDGYLVLNPQDADLDGDVSTPNERIDQMYFLISGDIHSMPADYSAGLAIVLYGPDVIVDNPPLEEPYEWVFTRKATLITSDPPGTAADASQSSFAELLADPVSAVWVAALTKPDLSNADELPAYLVGHVIRFRIVRYYMAGAAGPDEIEAGEVGTPIPFLPADDKPAWIEFEIILRDANNRLPEDYTATYRVNLPTR